MCCAQNPMMGTLGCSKMTEVTWSLDEEPVVRAGMWGDPQPMSLHELHHQGSQHWPSWTESPHWNAGLTWPVSQTCMKQLRCAVCTTYRVSRKRSKPLARSLRPNLLPWSFLLLSTAHPQATLDWNFPGHPTLSLSWAFCPELCLPTSFPYFLFLLPIRLSPPWQGCMKAQLQHHAQHTAGTQ